MPICVLHLIPTLEGGGTERQLVLLANAQARSGHEVHVGLLRLGTHASSVDPAVSVHQTGARSHYDPRLVAWAAQLIRRIRPDVVQTWLPMMDVVGGAAARAVGTPWVIGERSSAPMYATRWQDRILRRGVGRFASAVVANSEAGLDYWQTDSDRPAVRAVIRNALPLDAIHATPPAAEWPAPDPGAPRILFAGRLDRAKDVFTFIQALQHLRSRMTFSALILGAGPDGQAAENLVRHAALEGMVFFGGYRDDLWSLVKAARVFVSTSRFEGQPNTVLEALACGTPVIVSDIPQHREFLDDNTALFAPPEDDLSFAAALAVAIAGPDPAARTAAGYGVVETLRTDTAVAAYDAVYQAVQKTR